MNKTLKTRWVEKLRSGDYKQGRSVLRNRTGDKDSYCCLGVLCDLIDPERWQVMNSWVDSIGRNESLAWGRGDPKAYSNGFNPEMQNVMHHGYVPKNTARAIHLSEKDQKELANLNDSPKSFLQMADWIEENL